MSGLNILEVYIQIQHITSDAALKKTVLGFNFSLSFHHI